MEEQRGERDRRAAEKKGALQNLSRGWFLLLILLSPLAFSSVRLFIPLYAVWLAALWCMNAEE